MSDRRPTEHKDVEVPTDPIARAEIEARNGLLQYDFGVQLVMEAIERKVFRLRPSTLLSLHREALRGLTTLAGSFRPADVTIGKSKHLPPGAHLAPALIEDMCDHVNENWESKTPAPSRRLYDVAFELDPSFHGRERANLTHRLLRGAFGEDQQRPAWHAADP